MRVLCVNDLPPGGGGGGAEVHLELLLTALQEAGHESRAFDAGAASGLIGQLWNRSARSRLEAEVAAFAPDLLHFHNVVRELSPSVLSVRPGLRRVLTAHDGRLLGDADGHSGVLRAGQRLRSVVDRRVARRRTPVVLAVSEALRRRFESAGFRAVLAAPWAAGPTSPLAPAEQSRDLAYVGRLDLDKGVDVLVESFLAADRPGARLLLAGAGSYRPPADPRVVALGRLDRDGVSSLLAGARAVALASRPDRRPEGAPLALVEALVHHRPLLVSDDLGCMEVARAGTGCPAGLVAPAGDHTAWTQAIRRLLDDDELVRELAAGAVAAAVDHSPAAGLAAVERGYRQASA